MYDIIKIILPGTTKALKFPATPSLWLCMVIIVRRSSENDDVIIDEIDGNKGWLIVGFDLKTGYER